MDGTAEPVEINTIPPSARSEKGRMEMKIMLVDDNEISNFIMRKFLEKMGYGSRIVEFTDPELAVAQIKIVAPDLLFLDLQMPILHGWQFLDKMKEEGISITTVILTSSTSERDKERMKKYRDVIYYAEKPMDDVQLRKIMKLLEKTPDTIKN